MSSVEWVVADIFLVTDSGQGKIEPRHHPLKYSSDISMGIDTIWGMWKRHAKKDVNVSYVGLWLSFVISLSYQRLCACAYLHVQRISVVCLSLWQDWRQARNKRERVNALSSPGSFIIRRTSERANLSETPALNCTTKTKLQPFISAMIRLAYDSNISSS